MCKKFENCGWVEHFENYTLFNTVRIVLIVSDVKFHILMLVWQYVTHITNFKTSYMYCLIPYIIFFIGYFICFQTCFVLNL